MINTVDDVLLFVEQNPDYRPTIGLIKTRKAHRSFLTWAAVHPVTGHQYVPFLSSITKLNPGAYWDALTTPDLHNFLRTNKQKAFLLTQQMEIPEAPKKIKTA